MRVRVLRVEKLSVGVVESRVADILPILGSLSEVVLFEIFADVGGLAGDGRSSI